MNIVDDPNTPGIAIRVFFRGDRPKLANSASGRVLYHGEESGVVVMRE